MLINLCHWGHFNVCAIDQLVVGWEQCPSDSAGDGLPFPQAWPLLSYPLRQYDLLGQPVALDVEFDRPQPAAVRDRINEAIGTWFKAANWGGYADDRFPLPGSTVIVGSDPMTSGELDINWYFDEIRCDERAFDGLINCLERIHVEQAGLRRVAIGE